MATQIPKWFRELEIFEKIKPLIIMEGNVLDSYQYPIDGPVKNAVVRLTDYLHHHFKDSGYESIVFFDVQKGFSAAKQDGNLQIFADCAGAAVNDGRIAVPFKGRGTTAADYVYAALTQTAHSCVTVMNFASRYIIAPDHIDQNDVDSFTLLLQASMDARQVKAGSTSLRNLLVMVVNKVNDLPTWFYLDNPNVKTITLDPPSREEREQFVKGANFRSFFDKAVYQEESPAFDANPEELEKIQDRFVAMTEGFSFTALNSLRQLCKNEKLPMRSLCDVVSLYKYGIRENPWNSLNPLKMKDAEAHFTRRVKGQDAAISRTMDVIKRAVTGLSGLQHSSHSKPKGVLFFAGPTGTGKTETAKTLAEVIFGDENSCIRFDMSEFSQSHSDQRLLGAPPGYVGYEAGGQLTNAVRKNPFSILLFDEIEKGHPSILDKFLQILEDGRMTDGQGNTVYFSESVIIFTSNLGIYTRTETGERLANVTPDMPFDEVRKRVRTAIEDYFKLELGRPEILNRIGENIIVFDFIRPDTADAILSSQLERIAASLMAEKKIGLSISDAAHQTMLTQALGNLENGGRGIGNIVESMLINPLSRYIFNRDIQQGTHLTVESINQTDGFYEMTCRESSAS